MSYKPPDSRRRFIAGLATLVAATAAGELGFPARASDERAAGAGAPANPIPPAFFPGFERLDVTVADVRFRGVVGGTGPPLLLLHGYPQTHIAWRLVAPDLAKSYTVIAPDLPGYGASPTRTDQPRWTKRRVGDALVQLMTQLGHPRFAILAHDRGARAGYRLALDYPDRVRAFASLTVVPTLDVWEAVDKNFAVQNYHWFLFAQPFDLPERLLASQADSFLDATLGKMAGGLSHVEPAALAAYRAAFREPTVRHAMCEDYRAAVAEDADADAADRAAGRQMPCPVLVLWSVREVKPGAPTPVAMWQRWANDVTGKGLPGGHLQPEESPALVLAEVVPFLKRTHS